MYAVEARVFYKGPIVVKVRPATENEGNSRTLLTMCEVWIDVFEDEAQAREFAEKYNK